MAKTKHTRGYLITGLLFFIGLVVLVYQGDMFLNNTLSESKAMPVRAVKIDGAFVQLTKKEIADITGRVCAGQNIATLDLNILKDALLMHPWVAQVTIKKHLPDTLIVSVIEHIPSALWQDNAVYDARSRSIFYPDMSQFNQNLVKLGAFRDSLCTEVYESAVKFIQVMNNTPYQMSELYLDNTRCYTMTLENGIKLILGRETKSCIERLERFIRAFKQTGLDINDVEYVDLRYEVGFAVGKKENHESKTLDGKSLKN